MPLHENFREYTKEEIEHIKRDVCIKNHCPYLGRIDKCNAYNGKDTSPSNRLCNYLTYTGKMRGCMPDECTHYKDKDVKRIKFGNMSSYEMIENEKGDI